MEHENQEWLYAWLRHRIKYDQEYLNNIDKYKVSVKNLNFSWQNLEGKFVIENFPKLTSLNLGNNELSEVEVRNCPRLEEIITSHNKLTKLEIKDCELLKELYTHNNRLTDLNVSELKKLKVLSYSENKLSDNKKNELNALGLKEKTTRPDHPIRTLANDEFINNTEITDIDISNEAGWEGKLEVKNCPNLTSLVVDNCGLTELVIEDCPNLELLSFRHNKVKEIDLSKLTKLEGLYCSNNQLSSLDLTNNFFLKNLFCDNNPIRKLEVKHLKNLESLGCFRCKLPINLDCSGLDKLEELYCANSLIRELNIDGCDNLEILDCAENSLNFLVVSDKPQLKTISCKENYIGIFTIENCPNLEQLDFSRQWLDMDLTNDSNFNLNITNIRKLFYDKKQIGMPDLKTLPKLERLVIGEEKLVYDENGKDYYAYHTEETDIREIRNIERIQNILDNPDDYSADDLYKLEKEDLYGVSTELRERLVKLMMKKVRKIFTPYQNEEEESNPSDEEENVDVDTPLSTPPSPQEDPKEEPQLDYKKLYLELLARVKKGWITLQNKDEITNSAIDEDKKQELYNLLAEKENTNQERPTLSTINYPLWISLGIVSISLLIGYLISKKYKKTKKNN